MRISKYTEETLYLTESIHRLFVLQQKYTFGDGSITRIKGYSSQFLIFQLFILHLR